MRFNFPTSKALPVEPSSPGLSWNHGNVATVAKLIARPELELLMISLNVRANVGIIPLPVPPNTEPTMTILQSDVLIPVTSSSNNDKNSCCNSNLLAVLIFPLPSSTRPSFSPNMVDPTFGLACIPSETFMFKSFS